MTQLFDLILGEMACNSDTTDQPKTLAEALSRPDKEQWWNAASDEITALEENGTFIARRRLPEDRPIGSQWVLRIKRKADGSIDRYKARVVAKGFSQRPGFDFDETFAPTARWAALRTILALAALEDMEVESVDISSAFLNGELEQPVTMNIFEGLRDIRPELFNKEVDGSKRDSDWVLELHRALYGLKQAPRQWHVKLHSVMTDMGFTRIQCDNSIWVFRKDKTHVIIPVYVDDMTIVARSKLDIGSVKTELKKRFKLHELGPISFLLGVKITRNRSTKTLSLSQRQCIIDVLEKFGMENCTPVQTPLDPSVKLSLLQSPGSPEEAEAMRLVPYREAEIGRAHV